MALSAGDVLYVWCEDIVDPHDKFCICVSPENRWFLFINSNPPRLREAAVEITSFELMPLRRDSYIDTSVIYTLSEAELSAAMAEERRHKGPLLPTVRARIKKNAEDHDLLKPAHRDAILNNL